jgi:hypothetical protein
MGLGVKRFCEGAKAGHGRNFYPFQKACHSERSEEFRRANSRKATATARFLDSSALARNDSA